MKILNSLFTAMTVLYSSCSPMNAQSTSFKKEYLQKLENSLQYTLEAAERMPAEHYDFKPVDGVRSFGEQMVHIGGALAYIGNSSIKLKTVGAPKDSNDKTAVISYLKEQFHNLRDAINEKEASYFEETTAFWAGRMTRRNILEILMTHTAHHRAQAIVHLRMNGQKAPEFIGW